MVCKRKISIEDYTTAERGSFAELWTTLVDQAKMDIEWGRRVRIAHDWRHSTSGMLRDFDLTPIFHPAATRDRRVYALHPIIGSPVDGVSGLSSR